MLKHTTPDELSPNQVEELVFRAVRNPDEAESVWGGAATSYKLNLDEYEIDTIDVRVAAEGESDAGRIRAAFPVDGSAVEIWDGSKWVTS